MINIAVITHTSSFSLVTSDYTRSNTTPSPLLGGGGRAGPATVATAIALLQPPLLILSLRYRPPLGGGDQHCYRCYTDAPDICSQLFYFCYFTAFPPAACLSAACSPTACFPAILQPYPQHIVVGCCCLLPAACTRHPYRWCCSHLLEQSGCIFIPRCCHSFIDVWRQASSTSLTYSTAVASVAP